MTISKAYSLLEAEGLVERRRGVGLLGADGAGKSTLLRHVIGLYLPDQGTCTTFGREAGRLGPAGAGQDRPMSIERASSSTGWP